MSYDPEPSSEADLRSAMAAPSLVPTSGIDTDAVVRRARARRRPKQFAVGTVSVLAIAGIFALGVSTLPSLHTGQATSDAGMMMNAPEAPKGDTSTGAETKLVDPSANLCGSPSGTPPASSAGLELALNLSSTSGTDGSRISGTAILSNTGTTRMSGSATATPVFILSQNGVIVSRTDSPSDTLAIRIDLGPGESFTYPVTSSPLGCDSGDLAPIDPGTYDLVAAIAFTPDASDTSSPLPVVVGGSVESFEMH